MIKAYYQLAKPGIIYGNCITAASGFFLASKGNISWWLLLAMLAGLALVMGGACAVNNYIDRDIDAEMDRTKGRSVVTGEISGRNALIYGACLSLVGAFILYRWTNPLTLGVALIGVVSYVAIYTPLKRRTIYSTLIGAIAGATPPVVGYCAVTARFDIGALLLFLILVFWQMPHFYAIALYRRADYAAASIPLLPIVKGARTAKVHMLFYIFAFISATILLTLLGFTGYIYLAVMLLVGLVWLWFGVQGFKQGTDDALWGRKMFLFSLVVILVFSVVVSLNGVV